VPLYSLKRKKEKGNDRPQRDENELAKPRPETGTCMSGSNEMETIVVDNIAHIIPHEQFLRYAICYDDTISSLRDMTWMDMGHLFLVVSVMDNPSLTFALDLDPNSDE